MSIVFLRAVNMSIAASWLVLAVVLLRLFLKRAPKWVRVLLWGIVALRLVCPFSIESILSLIPSAQTVSPEIMMDRTPGISTGIGSLDSSINPMITAVFAPEPWASANPLQILIPVCANLWLLGTLALLLYAAVSYLLLRRKVATAVLLSKNIYRSEHVDLPFVLGIFRPKIYLPFRVDPEKIGHIIAHEEAHILRRDHLWKPLGFLLLAVYWFNPLMWLGYILLCRDIELACDEKVIGKMDSENRAAYTEALVACSVSRGSIRACPLAFGEVGIKARVRSVMNYRRPALWFVILAVVLCVALAVCFLTDPPANAHDELLSYVYTQVLAHFESDKSADHIRCADLELLDIRERGSQITVYAWVLYEEYIPQYSVLQQQSGAHIPTVITVTLEDGSYNLVEYWEPRDGSYYANDIRTKFPWYLHGKALDSQRYSKAQRERCFAQAQASMVPVHPLEPVDEIGYNIIIDTATWDIDGDGIMEACTLTHGPTSGLFSVILHVESSTARYHDAFVLADHYLLSFDSGENGSLRLRGDDPEGKEDPVYFDIGVQDGHLYLTNSRKIPAHIQ